MYKWAEFALDRHLMHSQSTSQPCYICRRHTSLWCSRCRNVWYCGLEHSHSDCSRDVGYEPYLLLSVLPFTCPSLITRVEIGDGRAFLSASRGFRDTTIGDKSRIKLVCLYVSAQIVFTLCEQLEDLEMRSGGTKSVAMLTFSRLVFFEVQTFVELNNRPAESIISFSKPAWLTRRRIEKHQQCFYAVKELLEMTIRSKLAHCGTPAFSGNPRSMEASSVPSASSLGRSGQEITEDLQAQLHIVRDYVHVTQIITIGSGNVWGNTTTA